MPEEQRTLPQGGEVMIFRRPRSLSWPFAPASFGFVLWVLLLPFLAEQEIYRLLFLPAPLMIVPLGFLLAPRSLRMSELFRRIWVFQPLGAVMAAASFFVPEGRTAALLASGWLLVTALIGLCGLLLLWQGEWRNLRGALFVSACLYLPVGGVWLVLSRLGATPLEFHEPIILLTAVHFHYTGFAAPILAAETVAFVDWPKASRFIAAGLIAGTPLLAAGFVFSPLLKMFAVLLLAMSLTGLSMQMLSGAVRVPNQTSRWLIRISGASVLTGMLLALIYGLGEFRGQLWISILAMALVHGTLNAFGFALCGLLGWQIHLQGTKTLRIMK